MKDLKFLNDKLDVDYIFNKVKNESNILIEIMQVKRVIDTLTKAVYKNIAESEAMYQGTIDKN